MLKHVKRNKEGFVSLKLISSFKRVKHLTKDWRQVAFAIKKCSKRLEVNDLETKVSLVIIFDSIILAMLLSIGKAP